MNRTSHKTLWGIGDAIVIIVASVPVLWLASLSFKDPSTIADGSFLPQKWTLANYRGISRPRCPPGRWSTPSASP